MGFKGLRRLSLSLFGERVTFLWAPLFPGRAFPASARKLHRRIQGPIWWKWGRRRGMYKLWQAANFGYKLKRVTGQ